METQRRHELPEAISVHLAATILDVHHLTIRNWIRRGYIKAYRVGPLLIRIPRSEIARLRTHRITYDIISTEPHPLYPKV